MLYSTKIKSAEVLMEGGCEKTEEVVYERDECPICFEELNDTNYGKAVFIVPCGHRYHIECLKEWHKSRDKQCFCPECNQVVQATLRVGGQRVKPFHYRKPQNSRVYPILHAMPPRPPSNSSVSRHLGQGILNVPKDDDNACCCMIS